MLVHFIACENGWRGTAYLYRGEATRPQEIVYDPGLCATREEADVLIRARAQARVRVLSGEAGQRER